MPETTRAIFQGCLLDLRETAWRRSDAGQLEHAELLVVRGDLALALEHLDLH
jgi:hypothetical protein